MRFSLAIVAALLSIVSASPSEDNTQVCANRANARPFYRAYNSDVSDHFYTRNAAEVLAAAGYTSEGVSSNIFPFHAPGTIPLYRLFSYSAGDHFYTTNVAERDQAVRLGYTQEGVAGYVYPTAGCGSVPLFRLYSVSAQDHFYTTSSAERDSAIRSGYNSESVAGFVYSDRM